MFIDLFNIFYILLCQHIVNSIKKLQFLTLYGIKFKTVVFYEKLPLRNGPQHFLGSTYMFLSKNHSGF